MVRSTKFVIGAFVLLLVALGGGWYWGASGRWDVERALSAAALRSELLDARGSALAARVDVYSVNFGDASRHLEDAKGAARRAAERLRASGYPDQATQMDDAFAQAEAAQQLAIRLDQNANTRAAGVVTIVSAVLDATNKR